MDKILKSVGRSGVNLEIDVSLIQKLLNAQEIPGEVIPLKVDGKAGEKTYKRIEAFQSKIVKMIRPDGRIDPDGISFKKLTANAATPARTGAKPANTLNFSSKASVLLKSIETLATTPYDDQTSLDITSWVEGATIGYGHLISKAEWPKYKNGFTQADAVSLFNADLAPFVSTVKSRVKASITQNEFNAMVILAFNIGSKGFSSSSVLKLINDPAAITTYSNLETAWMAWNKSKGVINRGLINRRKAEWNIYTKGIYQRW